MNNEIVKIDSNNILKINFSTQLKETENKLFNNLLKNKDDVR